jgi:glycosyltransferase involved in cell wall biosynthesis
VTAIQSRVRVQRPDQTLGHEERRLTPSGLPDITLIGNPFEAIGRSEHIRTIWRALNAAAIRSSVYDVYGHVPEAEVAAELGPYQVDEVAAGIRVFHLNGEEIQPALQSIEKRQIGFFSRGYNVVAPAWELPRYPSRWARELDQFDEVWAPTIFVEEAIRKAVSIPVLRVRNACEPHITTPLQRSYFGIPEDKFVILYFFDLRSRTARKNPWAAIEALRRVIAARPAAGVHLALKLNFSSVDRAVVAEINARAADIRDSVTIIDATFTNNETKNLVRCCDCFLSLHRSEGFGRGPAEAMFFAKPVVATGWSGNMEYMNDRVAFPVDFILRSVNEGEYPEHEDQVWAEPDVVQAADFLIRIVDEPAFARTVGQRAREHMQRYFADAVLGRAYRRRLQAIASASRFPRQV